MVGFFVNTVVLRATSSGNPSFDELLTRVRTADLAAFAHQELPFERLVEDLNPPRVAGRNPLFDVFIGYHRARRRGRGHVRAAHAVVRSRPVRRRCSISASP